LKLDPQRDKIVESEKYRRNAIGYYENSESLIKQKEFAKAGEMLWGAIAEGVKALNMIRTGEPVRDHAGIRRILKNIVLEYKKKGLNEQYSKAADNLHVNFYETFLDESDFFKQYDYAKLLFGLLMDITQPMNRESIQQTLKP